MCSDYVHTLVCEHVSGVLSIQLPSRVHISTEVVSIQGLPGILYEPKQHMSCNLQMWVLGYDIRTGILLKELGITQYVCSLTNGAYAQGQF
jgi:hypothetical protein